jgi:multicomponent Na+:H+ antiporter subunit G
MDLLGDSVSYIADALAVIGMFVMTAGVYGMATMPDIYTKMHAAAKAVFLGVVLLLLASCTTGDPDVIFRVILIIAALMVATPVSSHVIIKAAAERGDRMRSPNTVNESPYNLDRPDAPTSQETGPNRLRTLLGE